MRNNNDVAESIARLYADGLIERFGYPDDCHEDDARFTYEEALIESIQAAIEEALQEKERQSSALRGRRARRQL